MTVARPIPVPCVVAPSSKKLWPSGTAAVAFLFSLMNWVLRNPSARF